MRAWSQLAAGAAKCAWRRIQQPVAASRARGHPCAVWRCDVQLLHCKVCRGRAWLVAGLGARRGLDGRGGAGGWHVPQLESECPQKRQKGKRGGSEAAPSTPSAGRGDRGEEVKGGRALSPVGGAAVSFLDTVSGFVFVGAGSQKSELNTAVRCFRLLFTFPCLRSLKKSEGSGLNIY